MNNGPVRSLLPWVVGFRRVGWVSQSVTQLGRSLFPWSVGLLGFVPLPNLQERRSRLS
ncbi:MAG: hypothetical protein AAGG51_15670 [Cyanobacteria bacterium P01_G01_bin.54]